MYKWPKEIEDLINAIERERDADLVKIITDKKDREYIAAALRETYKVWYPEE